MKSLSIREVRSEIPRLEEILAVEGELVVARSGQPIARVLPVRSKAKRPSHAALRARMKRLREGSETLVRQDRKER
jgi:antitoxin (DNA-binding transcriptional repressor) of toxin-antitoxin stability system